MRATLAGLTLSLTACGLGGTVGGPQAHEPDPVAPAPWVNRKPSLHVASPSDMAVGDELLLLGNDFIPREKGRAIVVLKGTFFDDRGGQSPVDIQKPVRPANGTRLSWRLWPNVVFHPDGNRLGYFLGQVQVINAAADGTQEISDPLPVRVQIRPSLIPRLVRPTTGACQQVVGETLGDTGFTVMVDALGLRAGTKDAPLTFTWAFQPDQWKIVKGYGSFDPSRIVPDKGAVVLEEQVMSGTASAVADTGSRHFLAKIGNDLLGDMTVKEIKTQPVPGAGNSYTASIAVAAVDATGKAARLAIPVEVFQQVEVHYDGSVKIAQREEPRKVSDCIPGGPIGTNVSYREDQAETRHKSVSLQVHAEAGLNIGLPPNNPFIGQPHLNAGFGTDVSESVSSSKSNSLDMSGQILPGEWGIFYRQVTKLYRIAKLIGRNKCGASVELGEAILTDWVFTPELATGPACAPESRLPKAEQFL